MKILGIDPGTLFSAYTVYDGEQILDFGKIDNFAMLEYLSAKNYDILLIEKIASYGMPVGETILETIFWTGRFYQIAYDADKKIERIPRKDIKLHFCGSMRAKDSNIIQALKDRFEPKLEPRKKPKGILKGLTADCWQSFALTIYYLDTKINAI